MTDDGRGMRMKAGFGIGAAYCARVSAAAGMLLLSACGQFQQTGAPFSQVTEVAAMESMAADCPGYEPGVKQVFWGDLHVHTAYSLDAYGYGTIRTPADAYRFAKGYAVDTPAGEVKLDRPLDFMAVTDHAEWLDLMYSCSEPLMSAHPYCTRLRELSTQATGSDVFREYVNPTITEATPAKADICKEDPDSCESALFTQWDRLQQQTNEANDPCTFTAFNGFEWTATPSYSHTHRNVIFANENVTPFPIDYIRYPQLRQLFELLQTGCRIEEGCDVLTIAHNMNMGDGNSFDIEFEDERMLGLRVQYERLVEITQEKGASECLVPYNERLAPSDCDFEPYITFRSRPKPLSDFTEAEWERMRSTYARGLLRRGLLANEANSGGSDLPLQVGFIGSTDSHTGLGGYVEEDQWEGTVFGIGDFARNMSRLGFNPGGIVGVWAEQNTRESIFAALKNREVYATSGPRIRLRFDAAGKGPVSCEANGAVTSVPDGTPMGGTISESIPEVTFRIVAAADRTPLKTIEVVKGSLNNGVYTESVTKVWENEAGAPESCLIWTDREFDRTASAFWYVRAIEHPTPRWSSLQCKAEGRCEEFPGADVMIQERAWASPIWYLPKQ